MGLYDSAAQYASSALELEPQHSLALYVRAAADLARGDGKRAAALVGLPPIPQPFGPTVLLPSCLYAPRMAYAQTHPASRAFSVPPAAPTVTPSSALRVEESPGFRILSPRPGDALTEATTVEVAVAAELGVEYVTVLVDDVFAGVSSVRPYRVTVDPRLFSAGPARLQAEGCGAGGQVLRRASIPVLLQPANRTLAPEEAAGREAVAALLESVVLPPLPAVAGLQLAGNGLLQQGQLTAAAAAFESAYALDAELPGLRDDLLAAYRSLGLPCLASAPEVHTLRQPPKSVALTFDDGPHPLITPWILDQLDKEDVKATFFLVGKQATLYPELVREIRRRGHTIGCHSYAHYSMRNFSPRECEQDLVKCRLALREACGETVTLFRPPGGYCDATVRAAAGVLGFTTVFWSCNITSYPGHDGRNIARELARQSAEGGIILLHNGEDETLDTLPYLIPELRRKGVSFVTISPGLAQTNGSPPGGKER
jgi:peptidoglycan/xylan/chitin deacetylase (PgdA/CDA1 family)